MKWILASASPRRRELLSQMGLDFEVVPAQGEENVCETAPKKAVIELARAKAREVLARRRPEEEAAGIIAADTIVVSDGRILGKPADEAEAFAMLSMLQGRTHQVYTGVAVIRLPKESEQVFYECTDVSFDAMTEDEIRAYIATREPMDKAGAYGIQGRGGMYIREIRGDYYNVVGLPICRLRRVIGEQEA